MGEPSASSVPVTSGLEQRIALSPPPGIATPTHSASTSQHLRGQSSHDTARLLPGPSPAGSGGQHGDSVGSKGNSSASRPKEDAAKVDAQRTVGMVTLAFIAFSITSGGPYGIEAAVGAAGFLPVLAGIIVLGITWSAPQALVSAELSTAFPSNGGYLTWVVEGLGPVLGFVNAANSVIAAVFNMVLYPVVLTSYISILFPALPDSVLWLIKIVVVVGTAALNATGIEAVGVLSIAFTLVVQLPFIIMPVVAAAKGMPFDWSAALTVAPNWDANFSVYVSTICWNAIGWVSIGNVASEVKDPRRTYPLGAALAVLMSSLNYLYPVFLCGALSPNASLWETGYFSKIGENISPWVGVVATVGSAFSNLNNFQPQMSTTARALRFAALYKMLPVPWLNRNWRRFNTPLAAIILESFIVGGLMSFGFEALVVINVLFYCFGLLLQFAAFLRLRYTRPGDLLLRPYTVPGGLPMAWFLTVMLYTVVGVSFYAAAQTAWQPLVTALGCNVGFLILGLLWSRSSVSVLTAAGQLQLNKGRQQQAAGPATKASAAPATVTVTGGDAAPTMKDEEDRDASAGDHTPIVAFAAGAVDASGRRLHHHANQPQRQRRGKPVCAWIPSVFCFCRRCPSWLKEGFYHAEFGYVQGLIEAVDLLESLGIDAGDPENGLQVHQAQKAVKAAWREGHTGTAAILEFMEEKGIKIKSPRAVAQAGRGGGDALAPPGEDAKGGKGDEDSSSSDSDSSTDVDDDDDDEDTSSETTGGTPRLKRGKVKKPSVATLKKIAGVPVTVLAGGSSSRGKGAARGGSGIGVGAGSKRDSISSVDTDTFSPGGGAMAVGAGGGRGSMGGRRDNSSTTSRLLAPKDKAAKGSKDKRAAGSSAGGGSSSRPISIVPAHLTLKPSAATAAQAHSSTAPHGDGHGSAAASEDEHHHDHDNRNKRASTILGGIGSAILEGLGFASPTQHQSPPGSFDGNTHGVGAEGLSNILAHPALLAAQQREASFHLTDNLAYPSHPSLVPTEWAMAATVAEERGENNDDEGVLAIEGSIRPSSFDGNIASSPPAGIAMVEVDPSSAANSLPSSYASAMPIPLSPRSAAATASTGAGGTGLRRVGALAAAADEDEATAASRKLSILNTFGRESSATGPLGLHLSMPAQSFMPSQPGTVAAATAAPYQSYGVGKMSTKQQMQALPPVSEGNGASSPPLSPSGPVAVAPASASAVPGAPLAVTDFPVLLAALSRQSTGGSSSNSSAGSVSTPRLAASSSNGSSAPATPALPGAAASLIQVGSNGVRSSVSSVGSQGSSGSSGLAATAEPPAPVAAAAPSSLHQQAPKP